MHPLRHKRKKRESSLEEQGSAPIPERLLGFQRQEAQQGRYLPPSQEQEPVKPFEHCLSQEEEQLDKVGDLGSSSFERGAEQIISVDSWRSSPGDLENLRLGLNPLAIRPPTEYKMSAQGEGDGSRRSKRRHRSSSISDPCNPNITKEGSAARCCDHLDFVLPAGSSHSQDATDSSQDSHSHGDGGVEEFDELECFQRNSFLAMFKSCRLKQEKTPLKIVRANQQFMYDEANTEYLDCINSVAHVGHCHPEIVDALSYALSSNVAFCGLEIDRGNLQYPSRLQRTLPSRFNTFLFCDSGSEAVDLAIQIARLYTHGTDVAVVDNAFHGSLDSVYHLSRKVASEVVDWVHVIPIPDLYRGTYQSDDPDAVNKYLLDTKELLNKAQEKGRKVACFISEPMLTIPGIIIPPSNWLQEIYKMVRECGGLCIADEVQTGLGRVGSHFWSFLSHDIIPDILVIGKHLGNGYPMAGVVTSREIASVLGPRLKEYQCTTAMDAVGCAVLNITERSQFMNTAASVGTYLSDQFNILKKKHEFIGDVRGKGFLFGVEIVWSKRSKKPSRDIAEQIVYRMKEENVLLANEGVNRNILMFLPPMCFTMENAAIVITKLDKVLSELPTTNVVKDFITGLPTLSSAAETRDVRLGIFQPQEEDEDEESGSTPQEGMDLEYAQHCYQDLD